MRADESGFEVTQQHGAWVVRMWWPAGPVAGGPQRIAVEQADDAPARDVARGISTTVLRRLDLAAALNLAKVAPEAQRTLEDVTLKLNESGGVAGLLLANEGVSERYLAKLAVTYKGMADSGADAPVSWLARLIDRRPETVKDHLKKARREGYLGTLAGKAGGELTDKSKAVLEAMTDAGS
ncbi:MULTISPECIES: hypothetical protein [unclassified Streptomyces]|uniref:hypothetical protein n=1 Tax=unclassified Streptomyces TaxID=2593676 RepID=UPI002DDB1A32|nr:MULTISPECIES: hypothetical protein [unclassified Streptomyces]WSC37378.1 hypothetical protein OHA08_18690 [Streptomyces sp. NBC_01763]WSC55517.1 hypothetical protein OG808_26500 [Streptomyces sp. NBC_01761]WSF86352.1 hypothetical protein OIE70_26595 [Streptomyces sp. NBC_01744]WSJ52922.1 hypothetical protein OG243_27230 [Streptomyces sp. NBC_01318]